MSWKCNSSQGKWLACSELKPVVTSDEFLKKLFLLFYFLPFTDFGWLQAGLCLILVDLFKRWCLLSAGAIILIKRDAAYSLVSV